MRLSLIVCTYQRVKALQSLLDSVQQQSCYPEEILIIDGSKDDETGLRFRESEIKNLQYYKVDPKDRGLTKQRNYGISKVADDIQVVAFLDDDIILEPNYFKNLIKTYSHYPQAIGVGGYITNEVEWNPVIDLDKEDMRYFYYDGFYRKESSRFKLRRRLGLVPNTAPGVYPNFGHGRSISYLPPTGKTYKVNQLMGGVSSFPLKIVQHHKFSDYFEGYGLYEDAHYTLGLSKIGSLYVNTAARLEHHHSPTGRPDSYKYGKMVTRNGWFVWRSYQPQPQLKDAIKWYAITGLLIMIRLSNVFTSTNGNQALWESLGRTAGLYSLLIDPPKE